MARKILKIVLWIILIPVILVLLAPALIYIPPIQDFAVRFATGKVAEATGMQISVEKLRLRFPLSLSVSDLKILQENGDTMLFAGKAQTELKVMPLLHGEFNVEGVALKDAFYQIGNADSLLWLRARIENATIAQSEILLKSHKVDLGDADFRGVNVKLVIKPDTVSEPDKPSSDLPWKIQAAKLSIADLNYSMSMMPTIDTLNCNIPSALIKNINVDLNGRSVHARTFTVDSISARYIYPIATNSVTAEATTDADSTTVSKPWTVRVDSAQLTAKTALYAQSGAVPQRGFDSNYIKVSDVVIAIDSLYNRGSEVVVPIRKISATERCGISISGLGKFTLRDNTMSAEGVELSTLRSNLSLNAMMGLGALMTDPSIPVKLQASGLISPLDIVAIMPGMRAMLAPFSPTSVSVDLEGTSGQLSVYDLNINSPRIGRVNMTGEIDNPFSPDRIGGNLSIDGALAALSDKEFSFLPIAHIPALQLTGDIAYQPGSVEGDVSIISHGGRLAGAGSWIAKSQDYNAKLKLDHFPAHLFMPEIGLKEITASISVDGKGYNPMAKNTSIDADVNLASANYQNRIYRNIILSTSLHAGEASGKLISHNPGADGTVGFDAILAGDTVDWDLTGDIQDLDLQALHLSDSINTGKFRFSTDGWFNIATQGFDIKADLYSLVWRMGDLNIAPSAPVLLDAKSDWNGSSVKLANNDLNLRFSSPSSIMNFAGALSPAVTAVTTQIDSMRFDPSAISSLLPNFRMTVNGGRNNVVSDILAQSGMAFGKLQASMGNDSMLSMGVTINKLMVGTTLLDSVHMDVVQHGNFLAYKANVDNRPGTFDDFAHIVVNGYAGGNRASLFLKQRNIQGENGFTFGINADVSDKVVTARFVPYNPTIAYQPWTLNPDNFVSYNLASRHIDANLALTGEKSFIKLFTVHNDSIHSESSENEGYEQEDLMVQLSNIKLQDWLSINPFAPPVKGDLSADMRIGFDNRTITGNGTVSLSDLFYGTDRVGDFDLDVNVANSVNGKLMADISLMVDSVKTITATGVLNDSTQTDPFMIDFKMVKFPLRVVNPFIPNGMAKIGGMLNGTMKVTGTPTHPVFDGYVSFDSTAVKVPMLGTTFKFSDAKIPVDSGLVKFNDYQILGCNSNPLHVNGVFDARRFTDLSMNLKMNASNMQVVKSDRPRGADMFGKAFIDLNAAVRGDMKLLNVDADVTIRENTNLTYILSSGSETITERNTQDMVHFVQFNDTLKLLEADSLNSAPMMIDIAADLHIKEGAALTVYISPDGVNRAQVMPYGDLDFTMSPLNGERLTGRININEGFVRYTPAFLSEKNFSFQNDSYIVFNGNMFNPVLNIHAVDVMRANVTQNGQNSRLVNFDVILNVTNTLDNMNVSFDLATNDDITVQNELAGMSAEQRANQAMNLLAYNVYAGPGTKATANLTGNPLYAFLASTLNTWAANNIRGVDISFGIDQYNKTYEGNTSTATSYSYRVSKSLFNDRFKIVVGGNYSTDANADENFSQNLINDISFEYLLNSSGSMYVRVFRHTGYESILEGEITQTGVGFVLKRKMNSLRDLVGIKRDK